MRWMRLVIAGLLVLIAAGAWSAFQAPESLLIVPGAADIQVLRPGIGEQVIIYRAPGPAYAWRLRVAGELAAHGWSVPAGWRGDMPTFNYSHISSFWFGMILEQADLDGEPNIARITVSRWVKLPCLLLRPSDGHAWNVGWLRSCAQFADP
jgi:hypothetical protein